MNVLLKACINKSVDCSCRNFYKTGIVTRFLSQERGDIEIRNKESKNVDNITKKDQMAGQHWSEENRDYFKTLRVFYSESNNVQIAKFLQSPIDLSPSSIMKWYKKKSIESKKFMQSYLPERNQTLGHELAAAHFTVYRNGAIKFHGDNKWIKADKYGDYILPNHFDGGYFIEALDCTDMELYYEGLQNFNNLKRLQWLSLNGCEDIDDWCLDNICGSFYDTLIFLDLRNCPNITELGLTALWKMEKLKILYLDDVLRSTSYEMTVLLLQEYLPNLEIKVGNLAEND